LNNKQAKRGPFEPPSALASCIADEAAMMGYWQVLT
jgi:hypothetical protein